MSEPSVNELMQVVLECIELQNRASGDWHWGDPLYGSGQVPEVEGVAGLRELAMRQHWIVFRLHHAEEDGLGSRKVQLLAEQLDALTRAIDAHATSLLAETGAPECSVHMGRAMEQLSRLGLEAHHLREEGKKVSHDASHASRDARLPRKAEGVLERLGEVDTRRMVVGRELLDQLFECAGGS